jgi:hypothetical protein
MSIRSRATISRRFQSTIYVRLRSGCHGSDSSEHLFDVFEKRLAQIQAGPVTAIILRFKPSEDYALTLRSIDSNVQRVSQRRNGLCCYFSWQCCAITLRCPGGICAKENGELVPTSGSNWRHLNRPQTEDPREGVGRLSHRRFEGRAKRYGRTALPALALSGSCLAGA